jgi:hypothetical protein
VSPAGQQAIDFADLMLTRGYSDARTYCQSQLAQVAFTFDSAEKLAGTGRFRFGKRRMVSGDQGDVGSWVRLSARCQLSRKVNFLIGNTYRKL